MKTFQFRGRLYTTTLVLLAGAMLLALGSCAQTIKLKRSSIVPAATGEATVSLDDNGNAEVKLKVDHLAAPENLTPPRSTYMIWAKGENERLLPLGQLKVSEHGKGKFHSKVPVKAFRLVVTAEDSPEAKTPSDAVVLSTKFFEVK
jgi:hypothetical protein